jgi:hypothetical protein
MKFGQIAMFVDHKSYEALMQSLKGVWSKCHWCERCRTEGRDFEREKVNGELE